MSRARRAPLAVVTLVVVALFPLIAQEKPPADAYARAHYTKHEFSIPMRDGTKLFTSVYVPKDRSTTYPIMLIRTPYSVAPYGVDQYRPTLGPSEHFMKDGFIVVYQDVRGRYMSEGEWVEVRPHNPAKKGPADVDESTDTWDTIDWLVKNIPANNGKVGMWGISYPGFYVSAGMIDAHPALVAASPQAPVTDYYLGDDSFHNGAFLLAHNFSFYVRFLPRPGGPTPPQAQTAFDWGTPDGYDFYLRMGPLANSNAKYLKGANPYWNINLDHPNYDAFWQARSIWKHFKAIKPAVLTVGGWYDAEDLQGPLRTYQTIEQTQPGRDQLDRHGPVDARQLVARRRRQGRAGQLRIEDVRVVSRARRVPVLRQAPQGARDRAGARSADVRHRAERVAAARDVAAEGRAEEDAVSGRRRLARLAGADGRWL